MLSSPLHHLWRPHASTAHFLGLQSLKNAFSVVAYNPLFILCCEIGILEFVRNIVRKVWSWVYSRLDFPRPIHVKFSQGDTAYEWIVQYLIEENLWPNASTYKISPANAPQSWGTSTGLICTSHKDGRKGTLNIMPTWDKPKMFKWGGCWFDVVGDAGQSAQSTDSCSLKKPHTALLLTAYTYDMDILTAFVEHTQERYTKIQRSHVIVHLPSSGLGPIGFGPVKRKPRRPLDTLILPEGVAEDLLADAREFLASEDWYNDAGVPHRRGYLLSGPPGTGKTTTIYSLAGELGLEIYTLSLSSNQVSDATLQSIASAIPKGAILLIEDIDVAFPNRQHEHEDSTIVRSSSPRLNGRSSTVTLSGLLNVLDGVASDEGRLFFATTNYVDRLDSAFLRPGRIDKHVEYKLTTRQQAQNLFIRWYSTKRSVASLPPLVWDQSLAEEFAFQIPEEVFSPAQIQGYLLLYKRDPEGAVRDIEVWVEKELEARRVKDERERAKRRRAKSQK